MYDAMRESGLWTNKAPPALWDRVRCPWRRRGLGARGIVGIRPACDHRTIEVIAEDGRKFAVARRLTEGTRPAGLDEQIEELIHDDEYQLDVYSFARVLRAAGRKGFAERDRSRAAKRDRPDGAGSALDWPFGPK